jgi:uncharacterized protein (DUF1800 family)
MAEDTGSMTRAVGVTAAAGATLAAVAVVAPKLGGAFAALTGPDARTAAAWFLNKATFGATDASVQALATSTSDAWFTAQKDAAPTPGGAPGYWAKTPTFHLDWVIRRKANFDAQYQAALAAAGSDPVAQKKVNHRRLDRTQFQESFWCRAVTGDDQLRHRMTLALSEVFVTSFLGSTITPRIGASWYDMLSAHAFGNYLDLIQAVTLHPAMGLYLNIIGSQQADTDPSRHPDENYAREIMQLMSIGQTVLNADGTNALDGAGNTIATYTHNDIAGLAKVFTGWGWYAAKPTATTFYKQPADGTGETDPDVQPLIPYPANHSQLSKTFLGATIAAYTGAAPTTTAGLAALQAYQVQSLTTALTVVFNHPNVGPFMARRLIQRFVTSNPSPAYVQRVAAAFNGDPKVAGSRGDLFATLKAVLTDPEASNQGASMSSPACGKLREPVVRMAHWLRVCEAASAPQTDAPQGNFLQFTDFVDPAQLAQAPLEAPSVFNFYDPYFVPPGTSVAAAGLVAPEFQGVDVLTVASYANLMATVVENKGWPGGDVTVGYAKEIAALTPAGAGQPDNNQALIDRINLLYFGGTMSPVLSGRLNRVLMSTAATTSANPTAAQIAQTRLDKVRSALILTMTAPDYLVQR